MDIDAPNMRSGFCPVCAQRADIWDDALGHWECCYCNWHGVRPDVEPHIKSERSCITLSGGTPTATRIKAN